MLVYKFGGGSVKDVKTIKILRNIVVKCNDKLIIVISALNKITNNLEKLSENYFNRSSEVYNILCSVKEYHFNILYELLPDRNLPVYKELDDLFTELENVLQSEPDNNYDLVYDEIVTYGELVSTKIISAYLNYTEVRNTWLDARKIIITDECFGDAKPVWQKCEKKINSNINKSKDNIFIIQGFIGATLKGQTTSLGREGSDYTASLMAYALDAAKVVIWKDVDGIRNADPAEFKSTQKLDRISYHEAIEMAFYGAKVIHPKTIKPLQNKKIPLIVNSFFFHDKQGTLIKELDENVKLPPVYIIKKEQVLISILPHDFSFILEDNLSKIFSLLAKYKIKVNLIQNSAISFSLCINNDKRKIPLFIKDIGKEFRVLYNDNLTLITIRHYTNSAIREQTKGKIILIQQKSRKTARFVVSKK